MKNTPAIFEWKSLSRLVASFLSIFFLVTTTACGSLESTARANQPNSGNLTAGQSTNLYDPLTSPKGGMNNYSDVDPRVDTSEADAKAKQLIKKASLNKPTSPLKEVQKELDRKGPQERVKDFSKDLSRSAQEESDQISKASQKNFGNLQENVKSFKSDVKDKADDIGQNVKDKADDVKSTAQQSADAITNKSEAGKSKV